MPLEPGLHWGDLWSVVRLMYGGRGRNRAQGLEIQRYLDEGWEPFAATVQPSGQQHLWLRRRVG